MKVIAKVIESMLTREASRSWNVATPAQTGATATWGWGGYSSSSTWGWGGITGDSATIA